MITIEIFKILLLFDIQLDIAICVPSMNLIKVKTGYNPK